MTPAVADVIAALETATEGNRDLDVRISAAIDLEVGPWPESDIQIALEGEWVFHKRPYTTSIDAAFTLVPDGWFVDDLSECVTPVWFAGDKHESTGFFQAALQHRNGGKLKPGEGRSFSLALCIAALRARAAQEMDDVDAGLVEVVARRLASTYVPPQGSDPDWDTEMSEDYKEEWRTKARAAIIALAPVLSAQEADHG